MALFGDNPFDDGLDFVGCPPKPTKLKLPEFPENLEEEGKLICWGRCMPVPDGERMIRLVINDFKRDPNQCGVYDGEIHIIDAATNEEWYKGELKFYYTRNYIYTGTGMYEESLKSTAFRFVAKGDIIRVSEKMPEWECLILCTKKDEKVKTYERIFVYGGLVILYDVERKKMNSFFINFGHNDGWYTHHPECSARPIEWTGYGDYIGHYCERGWLFVSPGKNFVFDPNIKPPTGRFFEEALREIGKECYTEEAIKYGGLDLRQIRCIHSYQTLEGVTECKTPLASTEFCQGLVYSREKVPWISFFSMGYWMDRHEKKEQILHLVEGNIKVGKNKYKDYPRGLYFYGFATQNYDGELKLVELANNKDVIGEPVDTQILLYLYNAGYSVKNPKLRMPIPIDAIQAAKLLRQEIVATKDLPICPFLKGPVEKKRN